MKKAIIRPLVLIFVFLGAIFIFSVAANQSNEDLTTNMAEATLPILRFYYQNREMNELHAYKNPMEVTAMRDSIMPIAEDRQLPISISTYGTAVDGISYEIRSLDGERLVADSEVQDYTLSGSEIHTVLYIENLIQENEEYMLILKLKVDDGTLYYYTRMVQTRDCYVDECLSFALQFHEYTFREDADSFIPTYMDAATGDPTTLNYVDLSCTLKQIAWADFRGTKLTSPVVSFKEINDSYNALILSYVMTYVNEAGEVEYYNVREFYRLRQTTTRMYVLNFERTMNQIFRGENNFIYNDKEIQLGIRSRDVEYKATEAGDVICFVQEGELWCYYAQSGDVSRVFSFRGIEGIDSRENYDRHDIKIASIDEAGSIDFIVYGYMNRGSHEGEVGIGVYHYDGLAHTVEEEVFLPSEKSFEILQAEMGQLMYINEMGQLYLMMEGTVIVIDLNQLHVETIVSGLQNAGFAISESNRYFAWVDSAMLYDSFVIHLMDFKNQSVHDVTVGEGKRIKPLGFMGEDFIYGIARQTNISIDAAGGVTFPMDTLQIMAVSQNYQIIKTYQPQSAYVDSIRIQKDTIDVNLMQQSEGYYISAGTDMIMNRDAQEGAVMISATVTEIKETQIQLRLQKNTSSKPRMITSKEILLEEIPEVTLPSVEHEERYYVYARGKVVLATDRITEAVLTANEHLGVVVGTRQQYVWMRAKKTYQNAFTGLVPTEQDQESGNIAICASAMLQREGISVSVGELFASGMTPKAVLETTLKEYTVIELTGCGVNEVLYYVSRGKPVLAMAGTDNAYLITGYTSDRIFYYDPSVRDTRAMKIEDADALFESYGNVFLAYYAE